MTTAEKIIQKVQSLPKDKQVEVLDFVDFLKWKLTEEENRTWADLSQKMAMRYLEDEKELYSMDDIKVKFHD